MLGLVLANESEGALQFGVGFWLLAATLPMIGFSDVFGKRLTRSLSPVVVAAGRALYGALFVVCVVPFFAELSLPDTVSMMTMAAAGVLQAVGIWTLFRAIRCFKASLVSALVAVAPLITVFAESTFLGLTPSGVQWIGIGIVIVAAAALALSGERELHE